MIEIVLSGSKSITNRLILLNTLFKGAINLKNISSSQDSLLMEKALSSTNDVIDIHHAGTAMRFLTSYYAIQPDNKPITLTGSSRMKERPIEILVNALKELGGDIEYLENEGCPPLKIQGKTLTKNTVSLSANISSQYITSLCLIGSKLKNGLTIKLEGKITSFPYINMTLQLLGQLGITTSFTNNTISIPFVEQIKNQEFIIESDWSSASYHYAFCALSKNLSISLKYLFKDSLQADRRVVDIYNQYFGIQTIFKDKGTILLKKDINFKYPDFIELDMNDCPDIAQTVAVTAFGLQIPARITGLETLKIKETDRLEALKNEIEKCGGKVLITDNSLELKPFNNFIENVEIATYNDHRMAMSFAPLKQLFPLHIKNPEVVEKSYTEFWEDMKKYQLSN